MPSPFDSLPGDCISSIISFTSPRDACVVASVSKTFESAVKSDTVWEKFLPSEYASLIPQYAQVFSSKKELYFALCDDPLLIEDGKKGGSITWGTSPQYWRWISIPESRFKEVPKLVTLCPFKINGALKAKFLSPDTRYSAYVIYKAKDQIPDVQKSFGVGLIEHETPEGKKWERQYLTKLEKRRDGWMEVKFGEFLNHGGFMDDRYKIVFYISEIKYSYWTPGFIIQGVEFRPVKKLW